MPRGPRQALPRARAPTTAFMQVLLASRPLLSSQFHAWACTTTQHEHLPRHCSFHLTLTAASYMCHPSISVQEAIVTHNLDGLQVPGVAGDGDEQ